MMVPDDLVKLCNKPSAKDCEIDFLAMRAIEDQTHATIARLVSTIWINEYYYGERNRVWYYFKNHSWKTSPYGGHITFHIMSDLFEILMARIKILDIDKKWCSKLKAKLSAINFANQIRDTAALHFSNRKHFDEFKLKLDSNLNLLCFKNGVYDLKLGMLRDVMPDDNISMQIDYCFEPYNLNNQIIPDEEMRIFYLMRLASALGGHLCNKLMILIGARANGKSLLVQQLLELALGPYAISWSTQLLKQEFNVCSPNPELASANKKRFINV
ncbi:hypothetical protein HK100_008466 [Physocladia obscura]|uniref:Bacteriophage/plasmid primase P4 C-terminal domain-containing protein n=1 Tax=Physocladia obscura TaxID=109957 RepID=A0AAD5SQQ3_9FUNG|nr:hypothetical protein HK100_008466 [Physocladia obscura]